MARILLLMCAMVVSGCTSRLQQRHSIWVDGRSGEPVAYTELLQDLNRADVVYLGEKHTIQRHHDLQAAVVHALTQSDRPIVVGFEMLEKNDQPMLDRYWRGELDFEAFASEIQWHRQWGNYEDYRKIFETAKLNGAALLALNAPREVIRQIGRRGYDALNDSEKSQLPPAVDFESPAYHDHLKTVMQAMSHASPERVGFMIQAQMVRDETMAQIIVDSLKANAGKHCLAVVICGSGHVNYGMGTARKIFDKMPDLKTRIIVMSASGDIRTEHPMQALPESDNKPLHESTPIADYLYVTTLK